MNEWPLLGREKELQNVRRLLSEGGHGGVVLAGPSGVGKTRLAVECLSVASALGYATGHITGTHAARGIPLGAFGALLSEAAQGPPPPGGLAGLLAGARQAIAEHARGRGLALLVDDAHLLDDTSATLTHQLATTRSAFVVATIRAGEVVPDPVVALWKDGSAERIDVRPLCPETIPALLEAALGGPVDGATVRHLASRCGGNVPFLRELVLGALDADVLREEGASGGWWPRHRLRIGWWSWSRPGCGVSPRRNARCWRRWPSGSRWECTFSAHSLRPATASATGARLRPPRRARGPLA